MRVLLKLVLDCPPDAAWAAIRSPGVFRAVSAPFTTFTSLAAHGFPESWPEGDHYVMARAFGVLPIGEQAISLSYRERSDGVRLMRDNGHGVSGALAIVTRWQHTMAVAPAQGDRTLYRDQLLVSAGIATLPLWLFYWSFWQWRAIQLRRLAPTWR
ncbi:hypothetical protein [Glaciihabitans sp. UYNi722]|uniref:hypothetical protein n=1 Tax=Glaciihabitans sp. UYNi722 TaxID=3156344 RepID=UPI003395FB1F